MERIIAALRSFFCKVGKHDECGYAECDCPCHNE